MEQKPKKKKHGLLTVLLVILALIVLIPLALYAYLACDQFHIDDMRAACDLNAPYDGEASYLADGDVEVALGAEDLYWLADAYDLLDSLDIPGVECKKFAVEIGADTLTLYAGMRYLGFLPVPIKAELSVKTDDALYLTIQSVQIGKWIDVPLEKLAEYGVESDYRIAFSDLLADRQIKSMQFVDDGIVAVMPFLDEFSREVKADMTADTLLLYGAETDDVIRTASACYRAETADERGQIIKEAVSSAQAPVDTMTRLLALCSADSAAETIETLDPLAARFLLPVSTEDVASCREAYLESIADYNRKLETLLNTLRERYQSLEIGLTRDAYVNAGTDDAFSLSALCPQLGLTDEQCHPVLLIATEPLKAPSTADLPLFSEIPKSRGLKLDMALDYMSYDIGAMLAMPDGSTALLYYASTGEMIVQCLPQATAESIFAQYRAPKIFNLDTAVYAAQRIKHDAPASDLSEYIVFLPWDIETVWAAKQR